MVPSHPDTGNSILVMRMPEPPEQSAIDQIGELVRAMIGKWYIVLLTVILTIVPILLYIWTTTPLFRSNVDILIDPRQRQTVESEVTPTGLGTSAAGADTLLLESQIEVLRSRRLTDALIAAEDLTNDPEFAGGSSAPWVEFVKTMVKAVIYGPQDALWQKTSPYDRAVNKLGKRMDVERQRNTYVIGVTVRTSDPEKSARLANRVAEIYIDQTNNSASDTTTEVADVLASKLNDLRLAANRDAAAVEAYRQDNSLIDAGTTLLVEQQLNDLNRELSQARADVQSTLALKNQIQAAIAAGRGSELRLPEIGESAVMSRLQTLLAEIDGQEADLEAVYMASHPALIRQRERKAAVLGSIRQESERILRRFDVAYRTAVEKAGSLEAEVATLEGRMADTNAKSVQLRELEREAASSREVYESFLRRSKEAREQIDIPSSTAQVISPARAASRPSDPPVLALLAGGLAFGLSLGLLLAFLTYALSRRPRHTADIEGRLVGVEPTRMVEWRTL